MHAGVYEKRAILDEYLVDHYWVFTSDLHLDDRLSLSHVSRRRRPVDAANDVHSWMARPRMSRQLYMTQVTEATSKTKKHFALPPIWRPLKISPPKMEKPTCGTELHHHADFHTDRRELSVPGQKNTYFPYRRLPWELLSHAIHFWKALV